MKAYKFVSRPSGNGASNDGKSLDEGEAVVRLVKERITRNEHKKRGVIVRFTLVDIEDSWDFVRTADPAYKAVEPFGAGKGS
jgi:hypothetical protein